MEGVQESFVYSSIGFGMAISADMQSDEFTTIGGFGAVDQNRYTMRGQIGFDLVGSAG